MKPWIKYLYFDIVRRKFQFYIGNDKEMIFCSKRSTSYKLSDDCRFIREFLYRKPPNKVEPE
jgi:hypothetical protein